MCYEKKREENDLGHLFLITIIYIKENLVTKIPLSPIIYNLTQTLNTAYASGMAPWNGTKKHRDGHWIQTQIGWAYESWMSSR